MTRHGVIRGGAALAVVVAVLAVVVVVLLPSRGSASQPRIRTAVRVLPLGDSITWGEGSVTTSSYRAPLWRMVAGQSAYTIRFVGSRRSGALPERANEGHSGYTIGQIRARLDGWMAAARPDVVLLHIGINDLNKRVDPAGAPRRLAELVDRIYADRPGVGVVLMGLLPTTPGLEGQIAVFNRRARALAGVEHRAGRLFRYVAPPALTAAERVDRLHPDDAGYRRMADAFFPALTAAVADRAARAARPGAGRATGAAAGAVTPS